MSALAPWCLCAALCLPQTPPASPAPSGASASVQLSTPVLRWRGLLELDKALDVVREGQALVAPGGLLASNGEALALVARAQWSVGQREASALLLESARVDAATRAFVVVEHARQLLEADELEAAAALLLPPKGAREPVAFPELNESWIVLARALARAGNLARAAQLCQRFLELAPLDAQAPSACHILFQSALEQRDLAQAQRWKEREEEVRQWLELLHARRLQVDLSPEQPLPLDGLALCWMQMQRWSEARGVLLELCTRFPTYARGWFHLGEVERLSGDAAAAMRAYTRALEVDPADTKSRFNRALLALQLQDAAGARLDFEALLQTPAEADPLYARLHLELARLLQQSGDEAGAALRYARYRALGGSEALGSLR